MKVLVIGSGGREHALLWKLAHSPSVKEVYVIPGNDGMTDVAHLIPVKGTEDILDFARLMEVDLTVAGPETVLTEGLADKFAEKGMAFFGPSAAAAQIEGSKSFAKNLMKKYKIPTAAYETFTDEEKAVSYIKKRKKYPLVIKADGLASGKGVVIAETEEQAVQAVRGMLEGKTFGSAGESVVIEELMEGEEANTGGMGAYAPAPVMTKELDKIVYDTILLPAVKAMKKEGCPFKGCLYAGLMITKDGPKVVEFNCRFGDPETEAVLPLLESDLAKIMLACTKGTLKKESVEWKNACAVDVVLASEGYPATHSSGEEIVGLEEAKKTGCLVFHAGSMKKNGRYFVNGGRVLNVAAVAPTLKEAQDKAYEGVSKISWRGMQYRHDIADKGLKRLKKRK